MTSKADNVPARPAFSAPSCRVTASNDSQANIAVSRLTGMGNRRTTTRVMMPSVPSLPMKSCLRSYPVLFFNIWFIDEITVPSANTASRPSTTLRIMP